MVFVSFFELKKELRGKLVVKDAQGTTLSDFFAGFEAC